MTAGPTFTRRRIPLPAPARRRLVALVAARGVAPAAKAIGCADTMVRELLDPLGRATPAAIERIVARLDDLPFDGPCPQGRASGECEHAGATSTTTRCPGFVCGRCGRIRPWCQGAHDRRPNDCDECVRSR